MKPCTDKRIGKLISLYEFGALEESERAIFLDHLIACEYCYDQAYSIEPFSKAFRNHRAAAQQAGVNASSVSIKERVQVRRPWWTWSPPIMLAASLSLVFAIAIGVVVFTGQWNGTNGVQVTDADKEPPDTSIASASPWKDIAIPKASYVTPSEKVVLRSPEESFNQAMAAYQSDDFASAVTQLEALSELEPDNAVEVKFYFGVSLLMVGRNQDAILPLRQAAQFSIGPRLESSHYYLALAYLKCNYQDRALEELDAAIAMKGQLRSAAIELKQQILDSKK
jgi:hypothetical protein